MANFVFGGEPLNNGKSNFQVSPAPANQSINDTDWNLLYAHLSDTREAISDNAYYFGLAQSASAVSGANKARLRLNASNIPQMSVNGGIYRKLTPDFIHIDDYAVGDGSTNDYAAITSAIADAVIANVPLVLGSKVYATASNIVISSRVTIIGTGYINNNISTFKALSGCTRVIDLRFESRFYNLYIDGNRQADYGLYMQGASFCHFDNLHVGKTKKDGIYNPDKKDDLVTVAINDNNTFIKPQIGNCGTIYGHQDFSNPADAVPETRTVGYYIAANQFTTVTNLVGSITSGDATLTAPLATFQTWGVRRGDPIRIGAGANVRYFTVASVTSETVLEVAKNSNLTITNERVAVAVGDGYHDERSGDNNINKFFGGLFRSNAGFAIAMDGLYGHNFTGVQVDYCPWWGVRVASHGADPVITSNFTSCYFEACRIKPFFLVSATSISIISCLTDQDLDDAVEYNDIASNVGLMYGKYKVIPLGANLQSNVETTQVRDWVRFGYSRQGASANYVEGSGWDGISTITASADIVDVNPAVSNPLTLNFATVIAMRSGQTILLRNISETNTLILQDRRIAGTGLWLNDPITYLPPKSTITLFCDGARWIECGKGVVTAITGAYLEISASQAITVVNKQIVVKGNSAPVTVTLPLASTVPAGQGFTIKDGAGTAVTYNLTVARAGADVIDGATSQIMTANWSSISIVSDGVSAWYLV